MFFLSILLFVLFYLSVSVVVVVVVFVFLLSLQFFNPDR